MPASIDTNGRATPLRTAKPVKVKPKPRTPRAPTPAERVTTRSRARAQAPRNTVERQRPAPRPAPRPVARPRPVRPTPDTADRLRSPAQKAKDARYVQSDAYVKTLQKARVAKIATGPDSERRRNKGQYGALGILHPWTRISPKDELKQRDFESIRLREKRGYDEPRTDDELRRFIKTGKPQERKATPTGETRAGRAEKIAPVLKVLDYTQRVNYATAGAAGEAAKGHGPAKIAAAAKRGIMGKDKKTFSNVLREHGVPNVVAGVVGFTLDVATDPTTYTTFGLGPAGRKAAADAAKKAGERATAKGASEHLAALAAKRAGERVAKQQAAKGKGVTVKFAGREIAPVTRATAVAGRQGTRTVRVVRAAGRKATPPKLRVQPGATRRTLRKTVRPSMRPAAVAEETYTGAVQAAGRARAHVTVNDARAVTLARELKAKLPAAEYEAVIDAIEHNRLGKLPASIRNDDKLRAAVHDLRSALRGAYREGRRAGAIKGKVGDPNYLRSADLRRLRRTTEGEAAAQARRVTQLERHELRAAGREAVAHEAAKGNEARKAAVATERARGNVRSGRAVDVERARGTARVLTEKERRKVAVENERANRRAAVATQIARNQAKADARKTQHAADIEFERAYGSARVSASKITPELRGHLKDLGVYKRANVTDRTSLRRAEGHLKRTLAKPRKKVQKRHLASAYGKLVRAQRRAETSAKNMARARAAVTAERKRTLGVAPAEAERLLAANEARGPVKPQAVERVAAERTPRPARIKPEPTPQRETAPRVEPQAPGGKRLERAGEKRQERTAQLDTARARRAAARDIPRRSLQETDAQYLNRIIEHADAHDLPLVKARAEKLLKARPTTIARGYFPRDFEDRILHQLKIKPTGVGAQAHASTGVGRKVARITPGFKRADKSRLAVVNPAREAADQAPFSTNIPLVTVNHLKSVNRAVSQGEFHKEMAELGRSVKATRNADGTVTQPALRDGEAFYKLGFKGNDFGLHGVNSIPASPKSGQFVALDKTLADELLGASKQLAEPLWGERGFDRVTGGLKRVMISTLGFHLRNMISDINQSYLVTPGHKLPGNIKQATTAAVRAHQQGKQWRPTTSDKTIKIAGKDVPVDDFLKGARRENVLDSGFSGRELTDLAGAGDERVEKVRKGGGKVGRALTRTMTSRENLMRLATYKSGLDQGLTQADAATVANKIHIDYGDLSEFERRLMRRVFPFYTWTARSLPLAAETFVKTPGKYATVEKLRKEIGKTTTGGTSEDDQRGAMTEAVQRGYPVNVGGKAIGLGLPQTLINELPTGVSKQDLIDYQKELGRFAAGMTNQLLRAPSEWHFGVNAVTRAEIEKSDRPLVAAPAWVQRLPKAVKAKLDVTPPQGKGERGSGYVDSKTGKPAWAWRGKADWTYDQLMLGLVGQAAAVPNMGRSQTTTMQALAAIAGVRVDPLNKVMKERATSQALRDEKVKLDRRAGILNQAGINADNPTPEYQRLRKRIRELDGALTKKKPKAAKTDILGGGGGGGGGGSIDILGGGGSGGGGGTVDILR